MPKPVAPPDTAPIEKHKKHALEVLADPDYQKKPANHPQDENDDVTPFMNNDKKPSPVGDPRVR